MVDGGSLQLLIVVIIVFLSLFQIVVVAVVVVTISGRIQKTSDGALLCYVLEYYCSTTQNTADTRIRH